MCIRDRSPALYNFIKFHFPEVLFFGISAQGAEYEYEEKIGNEGKVKVIKEESRKKLLEKTREGKRAFINNCLLYTSNPARELKKIS